MQIAFTDSRSPFSATANKRYVKKYQQNSEKKDEVSYLSSAIAVQDTNQNVRVGNKEPKNSHPRAHIEIHITHLRMSINYALKIYNQLLDLFIADTA